MNRDIDMSAQDVEEFTNDEGDSTGPPMAKDEEEKQPDTGDPNFVNNMIKQ